MKKMSISFFVFMVAISFYGIQNFAQAEQAKIPANAKPIKIKYAGVSALSHHITKTEELFKKLVEKKSGSVITVELYPAGQLFDTKNMADAVRSGAIQIGEVHPATWAGFSPAMLAYAVLGGFETQEKTYDYLISGLSPILNRELAKQKVKILGWIPFGKTDGILSKKPIHSHNDMKGLRVRSLGALDSIFFETVGAKPTIVTYGEVYTALQRGTVDAAYSGISLFIASKWYEVGKYVIIPPNSGFMHYAYFMIAMNKDWWEGLPDWAQSIILESQKESERWSMSTITQSDIEDVKRFEELGGVIYSMPEEEWAIWKGEPLRKERAYLMETCGEKLGKEVISVMDKYHK